MDWGHALKNGNFVTFDVVMDHTEETNFINAKFIKLKLRLQPPKPGENLNLKICAKK